MIKMYNLLFEVYFILKFTFTLQNFYTSFKNYLPTIFFLTVVKSLYAVVRITVGKFARKFRIAIIIKVPLSYLFNLCMFIKTLS